MKKIILALSAIALVVSCSQSRKWTDKERDEVRKVVRDRHDRSAIRHMEAKNYTNLEECVVTTIEETYPDYNRFDKLTGKTDTVDAVIVDCLGFTIGPNYENLPLLFPYDQLQQAGILPAGLSNDQVKSFYGCLTGKIKELYRTPDLFTIALFDEPGVPTEVADAMQQCASMVVSPAVRLRPMPIARLLRTASSWNGIERSETRLQVLPAAFFCLAIRIETVRSRRSESARTLF